MDCNKLLSINPTAKRCHPCHSKYCHSVGLFNVKGKNNPNYKQGLPKCIDCGKELKNYNDKRCWKCYIKYSQIPENNPRWKYGKPKCIKCGKELSGYTCSFCHECFMRILPGKIRGSYRSEITKSRMSLERGGTGIPYECDNYPEEFFTIRNKILQRDNYTCQKCGKKGNHVHHIDYNKQNCKEDNLIILCNSCNSRVNYNRDYWFAYFKYSIENYIYDSQN